MNTRLWSVALAASAFACSGKPITEGVDEPIRVEGAQFVRGELPGSPASADDEPVSPRPTFVEVSNVRTPQGYPKKVVRGRASTDAAAIALRLGDAGSGYWLFDVGGPNPAFDHEFEWTAEFDVSVNLAAGYHELTVAAVGLDGSSGTRYRPQRLCVSGEVPDNLNACEPTLAPPYAVISLAWDSPVDLDLRVLTPSGKLVDSKNPTTANFADGGTVTPADGVLDRDSNPNCNLDGVGRENLVFQERPAAGTYYVYANLFNACGEQTVHFNVELYQSVLREDGVNQRLARVFTKSGMLLGQDANGGAGVGLYVENFVFE